MNHTANIQALSASATIGRLVLLLAMLLVAGTGCADSNNRASPPAAPVAAAANDHAHAATPDQPANAETTAHAGEGDTLLDLRTERSRFDADVEETQRVVTATFGTDAPDDMGLTARVTGRFTAPDQRQTAYILHRRSALKPGGLKFYKPMLAVFDQEGKINNQFVIDDNYWRIEGVADVDGDGIDEIFLSSDVTNMGQTETNVALASLKNARLDIIERYASARLDACDITIGEPRQKATVFVSDSSGRPARHVYQAECSADATPPIAAYRRLP